MVCRYKFNGGVGTCLMVCRCKFNGVYVHFVISVCYGLGYVYNTITAA